MAAYATIGQNLWRGFIPYLDLFDHKQPLIYGFYAVVHAVAGSSTPAVRVTAFSVAIAAAVALYLLLELPIGPLPAFVAAMVFVLVGATRYFEGTDLNTEHALVLFAVLAVGVPLRYASQRDHRKAVLAGALAALMVATKIVGVFVVPAAVLPYLAYHNDRRSLVRAAVQYAAGFAVPTMLIIVWFSINGALPRFVFANWTYNRAYVSVGGQAAEYLTIANKAMPAAAFAGIALVVGAAAAWARRGRHVVVWVGLLWLLGSFIGAKLGLRDFPHYFAPVVAPAAVLLACAVPRVVPLGNRRESVAAFFRIVVVAVVLLPFAAELKDVQGLRAAEIARRVYGPAADVWAAYEPVGAWVARDAAGQEDPSQLFVAGAEPGFYWTSGLPPASEVIYDYPLSIFPQFEVGLRQTLCSQPPRYVVLPYGPQVPPYLGGLIDAGYEVAHQMGTVQVLRRVADAAPDAC